MTARKMGRPAPAYSETALFNWMLSQGYQSMWEAWSHSNYNKWLSPSIDRIDNTKSYVLDNIQLVTWAENLANQKQQNTDGVYLHSGSKSVDQLDQEGNLLQTFPSAAIAARAIVGHNRNISNITRVCHGKAKSAYGYKWRFTLALC